MRFSEEQAKRVIRHTFDPAREVNSIPLMKDLSQGVHASYYAKMLTPKGIILGLDTETTSLAVNREILQFAAIPLDEKLGLVADPINIFIKPELPIDSESKKILESAGLTESFLKEHGVTKEEARKRVVSYLDDLTKKHGKLNPLGHNVRFDLGALRNLIGGDNVDRFFSDTVLDSLDVAAFHRGVTGSNVDVKLSTVAKELNISMGTAHNAMDDALAAVGVFGTLREKMGGLASRLDMSAIRDRFPKMNIPAVQDRTAKVVAQMVSSPKLKAASKTVYSFDKKGLAKGLGGALLAYWSLSLITGTRDSETEHDQISGINHSGPAPRRDPFGSGRDSLYQFVTEANFGGAPWIRSSTLGMTDPQQIREFYSGVRQDNNPITASGKNIHAIVQRALGGQGVISDVEYFVSDPNLKTQGYIDVLLKNGIPLEIKTVESEKQLNDLLSPKPSAMSQANFYAVATGAPFAYVMYTTRMESDKYKIFKVPVNFEAYKADVMRLRSQIAMIPRSELDSVNTLSQAGESIAYQIRNKWRALGGRPENEMTALPGLGDYGKIIARTFKRGHAGQVQFTGENALRSKIRSQHCRYGAKKYTPMKHPIGSRAERVS